MALLELYPYIEQPITDLPVNTCPDFTIKQVEELRQEVHAAALRYDDFCRDHQGSQWSRQRDELGKVATSKIAWFKTVLGGSIPDTRTT